MRVANYVAIDLESGARVGLAKLALDHFRRSSRIEQECCMSVPECMETAPWDSQRVEDRPEPVLHDFVG